VALNLPVFAADVTTREISLIFYLPAAGNREKNQFFYTGQEMGKKRKRESRGTDDPFFKLMKVGGEAVLKLIGIDPPDNYISRAVVLKEKKLYPDIMAVPKKNRNRDRVFIEFQGYKDTMIRYRLTAQIAMSCAQDRYTGPVCGAIIYTDRIFKEAALPLDIGSLSSAFRIKGSFEEIVLSEYTCEQLTAIDPRLTVLAPFTLPKNTGKEKLSAICRDWKQRVCEVYETKQQGTVTEILGLFILNRFSKLSLEEVIRMLNFDLSKTKAGKELIDMGMEKGMEKGALLKARNFLLLAMEQKWGKVPQHISDMISKISVSETLEYLFGTVLRSSTFEEFEPALKKNGSSGNA